MSLLVNHIHIIIDPRAEEKHLRVVLTTHAKQVKSDQRTFYNIGHRGVNVRLWELTVVKAAEVKSQI